MVTADLSAPMTDTELEAIRRDVEADAVGAERELLAEVDRLRAVEQNLRDIIAGALVEYAMAYRWPNGNVVPFGVASYYRAGVQRDVDKANRAEQGSPALLARRLVTRWHPVVEEGDHT